MLCIVLFVSYDYECCTYYFLFIIHNCFALVQHLFLGSLCYNLRKLGRIKEDTNGMDKFEAYIAKIDNPEHRARTEEVLRWVAETFPALTPKLAWNQPMFTERDTFIIGFSVSKKHLAVAPERAGIRHCEEDIAKAGYDYTKELVRIPWDRPVPFPLLEKMIAFNRMDKAGCTTFWR